MSDTAEKTKMKLAIIGVGTIGSALYRWLERHNPEVEIVLHDPEKGMNRPDVYEDPCIDAYFVCVNVDTDKHQGQDILEFMEDVLVHLKYKNTPVYIRSTILPKYLQKIKAILGLTNIHFLPEFLTERDADDDMERLPLFVPTGSTTLLSKIFPGKILFEMSDDELMTVKYFHNLFGAMKVTFFNCVKSFCDENELDFQRVVKAIVDTKHISSSYTQVPGPDGKFGYGGKCFPKDIRAFRLGYPDSDMSYLLDSVEQLNTMFRKEDK